ncbi:MAG: hypothetical protein IJB59_09535 [Oscillospiraceae bacterium]|nr:hypothetical protein [Oscillospiraceae bacterium]
MRYLDAEGKTVEKEQLDLTKGYLTEVQVIREDAAPIDNVTKFFYTRDDYEMAQQYFLYRPESQRPTQEQRITELEEALELLLSGVTE